MEILDEKTIQHYKTKFFLCRDVTGYKFVKNYMPSWGYWENLLKDEDFAKIYELWQKELSAQLLSEHLQTIEEIAKEGSEAQRLSAAKYLAEGKWQAVEKSKRGRPSKEEVTKELKEQALKEKTAKEDASRIGLSIN